MPPPWWTSPGTPSPPSPTWAWAARLPMWVSSTPRSSSWTRATPCGST